MKKQMFALLIALLLLVIAFIGCLEDSKDKSQGRIIYVDVSGDKDFISIQDAINNSRDGDSIVVSEGIYYEFLRVNKSVDLKGFKYTFINPNYRALSKDSLIYITANNCSINGFTLFNDVKSDIIGININSSNNMIKGNSIIQFKYGIYIKDDVNENVFTKNNISDNVISNCTYGICV